MPQENINSNAKWIWLDENGTHINQYVEFRHIFMLGNVPQGCFAFVSVDSDYELWINGSFDGWNQYPNWPGDKTYNKHNVDHLLKKGRNCIAIRVYYRGSDFFTYAKGRAGLIFSLQSAGKAIAVSSGKWLCRQSESYKNGEIAKINKQLAFTVEYDGRAGDNWQACNYNDSEWENALEIADAEFGPSISKRPVENLQLAQAKPALLVAAGTLKRTKKFDTVAETMMNDFLCAADLSLSFEGRQIQPGNIALPCKNLPLIAEPNSTNAGMYFVFDLGCEEAGLLTVDVDATESTILDVAHGEHLDDLRVRSFIGGRNFADRYICKEGRQKWMFPYRRCGGRFLQVHVPKVFGPLKIYHVTLMPVRYPFEYKGSFECPDTKLNDIWTVSRRTLELCAHEHYEDCPWREQSLYAYDGLLQMLYGFYTFGDARFAQASLELLGKGMCSDGLLAMTAPARPDINIPCFSFHWITAVLQTYLFSGDKKFAQKQYGRICEILDKALDRITPSGMVKNSSAPDHWHFYEWKDCLDGHMQVKNEDAKTEAFDAIYNLLLFEGLKAAVLLGKESGHDGYKKYAGLETMIKAGFHRMFWSDKEQAYASFRRGSKLYNFCQLTQALVIRSGIAGRNSLTNQLCRKLAEDKGLIDASYPSKFFVHEALLGNSYKYMGHVLEDTRNTFGAMLAKGATSLWETQGGAEAFDRAGSLCHAWSCIFNYVAGAYLLGVRPLEPGFKTFSVSPCFVNTGLGWVRGKIPTPKGLINLSLKEESGTVIMKLRHPSGLTPRISIPGKWKLKLI